MEAYTEMQSVEFEEMPTFEESGVSPMPNANVLLNFAENEAGKPTYKGEPIGTGNGIVERPTDVFEFDITEGACDVPYNVLTIGVYSLPEDKPALKVGSEIKSIEIQNPDTGLYIPIEHMHMVDSKGCYVYYDSAYEGTYGEIIFASVFFDDGNKPWLIERIQGYQSAMVRITYYTD